MVRVTVWAHNISRPIGEGILAAFLARVIAGDVLDNIVMAFRTTYFPGSCQTSPRRIWSGHDDANRSDCPNRFRNELPSRLIHCLLLFG